MVTKKGIFASPLLRNLLFNKGNELDKVYKIRCFRLRCF